MPARCKFKINDDLNFTADASYGEVGTLNRTGGFGTDTTFAIGNIQADNAFLLLNPALQNGFNSAAFFGPASLTKDWSSQVDSYTKFDTKVFRTSAGLDGRFGESTWTWDAYWQYGKTRRSQLVNDNKHNDANAFAIDAVFDSRDSALPVNARRVECRVTQQIRNGVVGAPAAGSRLYNIAQGCVPINPFGTQAIDTAARNYSFGYLDEELKYEQQVVAFNTTGDHVRGLRCRHHQGRHGRGIPHGEGSRTSARRTMPMATRCRTTSATTT